MSLLNNQPEPSVCIGLPTLGDIKADTVMGLINIFQHPSVVQYSQTSGTLLPWARDQIIRRMATDDDGNFTATHLLFIDADMAGFHKDMLTRMLDHDKDIISGVFVARRPPHMLCTSFFDSKGDQKRFLAEMQRGHEAQPIEVDFTGLAFTLIKTEVLVEMAEETPSGPSWFAMDREPRETMDTELEAHWQNFIAQFKNGDTIHDNINEIRNFSIDMAAQGKFSHKRTDYLGEDVNFCRNARRCGFKTWVDPVIHIGHIGEQGFDFKDAIKCNPSLSAEQVEAEQACLPVFS